GAFAEFIVVPAAQVYPVPDRVSFHEAAYAEPLAAALAVLRASLPTGGRGLIVGCNRFARLVEKVLVAHGCRDLSLHDPARDPPLADNSVDFAIETIATSEVL